MYLSELSELVTKLQEADARVEELERQVKELETDYQRSVEESERLRILELITGKKFTRSKEEVAKQLKQCRRELAKARQERKKLYEAVGKGMAELLLNIPSPYPEISEGEAVFRLDEDKSEPALNFIKTIVGCKAEVLEVKGVQFLPDKVIVKGVETAGEATKRLFAAVKVIKDYGKIMAGECPPKIAKAVKSLRSRKSPYAEVWKLLALKERITTKETYEVLGIEKESERKKIRAFLSELKKGSIVVREGEYYSLSTKGRLVKLWYERVEEVFKPPSAVGEEGYPALSKEKGSLNRYLVSS